MDVIWFKTLAKTEHQHSCGNKPLLLKTCFIIILLLIELQLSSQEKTIIRLTKMSSAY